ncbi:MAG: hypothetical protein FWC70_07660 [Defluviitaleaceae bacterium]|nr:hypothetical protein [Defluviitaleaceae bacterium]
MNTVLKLCNKLGISAPNLERFFNVVRLDEQWVTMNGARVLISDDGEIKSGLDGKHNGENITNIARNSLTTEEGFGKIITPTKEISKVYDSESGMRLDVVADEPVTNKYTMAGTSGKKPVRQADRLSCEYGGDADKWTKQTQDMTVSINGVNKRAEIHSFYNPSVGYVEQKISRWR